MREITFEGERTKSRSFLLWLSIVLLGGLLGTIKLDNTFWYKSATLAYALSSIVYVSTFFLRDRLVQNIATLTLSLGLILNLAGMVRRTIQTYELGVPHPPWSNLF